MKTKKIILPSLPVLLVVFCSFANSGNEIHPNYDNSHILNLEQNLFVRGKKSFDEVRFIRRKAILKVFTDVITKYKEDIPDPPDELATNFLNTKINQLINKYNL